ncbi:hypothetical protein P9112_000779 [Eukaryota sp. TZLM1-RC]
MDESLASEPEDASSGRKKSIVPLQITNQKVRWIDIQCMVCVQPRKKMFLKVRVVVKYRASISEPFAPRSTISKQSVQALLVFLESKLESIADRPCQAAPTTFAVPPPPATRPVRPPSGAPPPSHPLHLPEFQMNLLN